MSLILPWLPTRRSASYDKGQAPVTEPPEAPSINVTGLLPIGLGMNGEMASGGAAKLGQFGRLACAMTGEFYAAG